MLLSLLYDPFEAYGFLLYVHLWTIIPCIFLGAAVFIMKKGTTLHKRIGWLYMVLMFITGVVTLFLPAFVGPKIFNHFGWIHLFSFLTIYSVPTSIMAIRKGNVRAHKGKLIGLYIGAILIAGAFTLMPGRYLHSVFFG